MSKLSPSLIFILSIISIMAITGFYRLMNPVEPTIQPSVNVEAQIEDKSETDKVSEELQKLEAEKAQLELELQKLQTKQEAKQKIKEGLEMLEVVEDPKDQAPQN